jgi:DNA-binding beta-propeller fold protein YncE
LGVITIFVAGTALIIALAFGESAQRPPVLPYHSPFDVAFSPDGKLLAASDRTAGTIVIAEASADKVAREIAVKGQPTGLAWANDGGRLFASLYEKASVVEIDPVGGREVRRIAVGAYPMGLAFAPKRNLLVVANSGVHSVSIVDAQSGSEKKRIAVRRQPFAVALTPDESLALVSNLLPLADATESSASASVSLIDLEKLERIAEIRLPGGSTTAREIVVSPDGRWAYLAHTVGRFTLPTTQLERGWVNTNAFSVIDIANRRVYATLLLDQLTEGAADPWGLALSKDGKTLWVTLSGVHQIARVDLAGLHELLEGRVPESKKSSLPEIWQQVQANPADRDKLINDLTALYAADLMVRTPIACKGPRGCDLSPDGRRLAAAAYFSGKIFLIDTETGKVGSTISLGDEPPPDVVRLGESIFHDATFCFQHWQSCATCHPDVRVDGLNWDLLNDGIGNPKNTKSLVRAPVTPPSMSHGVRADFDAAALAGFRFILFREPEPADVDAVRAYIRSLEPEPSPHLTANGELSEAARRGRDVFRSPETGCSLCHPEPLFTDLKIRDVGTLRPLDQSAEFDTPTLLELWRTAPYLHSGEAVDLKEVFTKFNPKDQHGKTSQLTAEQLDDLVQYLLSL